MPSGSICVVTNARISLSKANYLRQLFSKGSQTTAKKGWSWLTSYLRVHSWDQDPYVFYPMHRHAKLLLGPLAYVCISHCPQKSTFVCGWMPDCCWGWGTVDTNKGHIIWPSCWHHSPRIGAHGWVILQKTQIIENSIVRLWKYSGMAQFASIFLHLY